MRNQNIEKVEVLDKVKELFLIPKLEMMSFEQVAKYYEVSEKTVRTCYLRNKEEIKEDGHIVKKQNDFLNLHFEEVESSRYVKAFKIDDNMTLIIPNCGITMFSKRAVLRFGMLLRDSKIAKEVRTQLLNTFEATAQEQPQLTTRTIDEEKSLVEELYQATISGDYEQITQANAKILAFKTRHIKVLQHTNKLLTAEILEWSDRAKLNRIVRVLATHHHKSFGQMWNIFYKGLSYKYGIQLKKRGESPYINHIKESEWGNVQKLLIAMCEKIGVDADKLVECI